MNSSNPFPDVDRKALREFGLIIGGVFAGLFGLAFPLLFQKPIPIWPWGLAVILAVWAVAAPNTLRPVYRLWMRFGLLLNKITTPLILGLVFFLIVTPTALIMRLIGKDPMARALDSKIDSYRVISRKFNKNQMEKPF